MLYNPPTGATDPSAPYLGKNTAAGQQGSRVPPMAIEAPQREIVATIVEAGLPPTNTDLRQLLRAIRGGRLWTFQDVGAPGAISIQPTTPHTALYLGLPFRVIPAYPCPGPDVTVKVSTLTAASLKRRDGSSLARGDYAAGAPVEIWYDGLGSYRLSTFGIAEIQRNVGVTALYVRTDGSDSNDGSANDAAHAFATLAGALSKAALYAPSATVNIYLGLQGVYTSPGRLPTISANIGIIGDPLNKSSYVIAGAGSEVGGGVLTIAGGSLSLKGLTLSNIGTSNNTLNAQSNASVTLSNVVFMSAAGNAYSHVIAASASVTFADGCVIAGSMGTAMLALYAATISLVTGSTLTVTGTPAIGCFAIAQVGGNVVAAGGAVISGSATGTRYLAISNGVITTAGGGASFFPGNVAGSTSTGGQYL